MNDTDDYLIRQSEADRRYIEAWNNAPKEFKDAAEKAGIGVAPPNHSGMAMEYQETYLSSSVSVDMASVIDRFSDMLVEKHGGEYEAVIRAVAADFQKLMEAETERSRALLLSNVVGILIQADKRNLLGYIHGLLHAIPLLAHVSGFSSMRASARASGCTVEWIRKQRLEWCSELGLPVPFENQKTQQARAKYRANALSDNHWKRQRATKSKMKSLFQ